MADHVKEFYEQFAKDGAKMKEQMPDAIAGFSGMFGKIMKDGALSLKEKELIAVAIGVAVNCTQCIRLHTKKCVEVGATRQEILEAVSVSIMMGGGPAYTHIPHVIDALDALGA